MAQVESSSAPTASPEYRSIARIQGIPLVNDSLSYAHNTLSTNPYTQAVYATALGTASSAYRLSQPVQVRLAPLILRADGVVLKGLDVAEATFPYPFTTSTEQVINTLKSSSDQAYGVFQANIQAPAYSLVQQADQRLSPVVDQFESLVNKLHSSGTASSSKAAETTETVKNGTQSQIERGYRLSLDLKDQLYALSGEQFRQVQRESVVVQRATDTVYHLNEKLVAAYGQAKETSTTISTATSEKVHGLSAKILQEVEKVQASTKSLPSHLQQSIQPLQNQLAQSLTDLKSAILQSSPNDSPVQSATHKAGLVAAAVQNQVGPVLEAVKITINNILAGAPKLSTPGPAVETAPAVNGNGSTGQ